MRHYLAGLLLLVLVACESTDFTADPEPFTQAEKLSLAPYPNIAANLTFNVIAEIRPDTEADRVVLTLSEVAGTGSRQYTVLDELSDFDPIPGDFVFMAGLPSGDFYIGRNLLRAEAYLGEMLVWSQELSDILALNVSPPELVTLDLPDSLKSNSGERSWQISFTADPSQGTITVYCEADNGVLWQSLGQWRDDGSDNDLAAGDGNIQVIFPEEANVGLLGQKNLRFRIVDEFAQSDTVFSSVYIENTAPVIVSTLLPDTLVIQPAQTLSFYGIEVADRQTLADIDTVSLSFYDQDGAFILNVTNYGQQGNQGLADDGIAEDEVAGDGIYSILILNPNDPADAGNWTLRVYARDKAGQLSDVNFYPLVLRNE
jgi:hypothetical protein